MAEAAATKTYQRDSYVKQVTSTVINVELNGGGMVTAFDLEDSVVFPGGGGQPCDFGLVQDKFRVRGCPPVDSTSKGVRHEIDGEPLPAESIQNGMTVTIELNWKRRWDHMQQHSGQHLMTAVADKLFSFKTTSWSLGEETSSLDLDTKTVTPEQLIAIEQEVNRIIRDAVEVGVTLTSADDPKVEAARSRGLPDNVEGPIRIVSIGELDSNLCCGTHVRSTSHLVAIKIVDVEAVKKTSRLHFVAGERVTSLLGQLYQHNKAMTQILSVHRNDQVEAVKRIQKAEKEAQKRLKNTQRELGKMEATLLRTQNPDLSLAQSHRPDVDMDYVNGFISEFDPVKTSVFVTYGKEGQFLVLAEPDKLSKLSEALSSRIDYKGNAKGSRFQGKLAKAKAVKDLCKHVVDLLETVSS